MKQYLGLTAAKAIKSAQPTEMSDGTVRNTLKLRGVLYIVSTHAVETYRGHNDVAVLDSLDHRIVLYA
jgi:hypothetical protein